MKTFAFVLLCALAAVQGRYTALQSTRTAAALGENPWLVHLRVAVSYSGLLNSCVGSLIDSRWVLTSANCVDYASFIWVRYGAVNVINPSLVTETSAVRTHPENNVGLVSVNRYVQPTEYKSPISLNGKPVNGLTSFCIYGEKDNGAPGEVLSCYDVTLEVEEDGTLVVSSDEVKASASDSGAPLVINGAQVGLLVEPGSDGSVGKFIATADYKNWIEEETGIKLNPNADEDAPEAVRFIQ